MKNTLLLFTLLLLISCKREEFTPTYSSSAFTFLDSLLNLSANQIISDEDRLVLEDGWEFYGWDTMPGKTASFPDISLGEKIQLPHKISHPNSNVWYLNRLNQSDGYLWINADDGAQLWINGERVLQNSELFFPIPKTETLMEIHVRVINNAASGGLRQVFWVNKEIWEKSVKEREDNFSLTIKIAKENLWMEGNFPKNWKEYPIWYSSPVLIPISKDSLMLRWTGEKNAKAKLHFGHDPNMVVNTKEVMEENGIYSAIVSSKKCHYFHFEMNKTVSPLFKATLAPSTKSISFAVWADSQGGWETFSEIAKQMKNKNPQFTVGIGDLVGNGGDSWQYVKFLSQLHEVPVPHYLFPGNHDYDNSYNEWVPTNFIQNLKYKNQKNYQFWQEGPCAFIALDPNENFPVGINIQSEQYDWFQKTINSDAWKNAHWKIVFVHQPPFSQGWKGYKGEKSILDLLKPFYESGQIDLVVSGHTHDYERLILDNKANQTAFVIVGGAGGNLEPEAEQEPSPKMDKLIRVHHFGWIVVDQEQLEFEAVDVEGRVIDRFVLKR
ncbi:metallophosphoesterase [Aquiflexum sp.]|uniref:metallophosphoesterase family protein n=1 Tax=Aquiflexum sp. TaxID=1872584 RepID=UPI00359423A9